jgi:hypothetical protein
MTTVAPRFIRSRHGNTYGIAVLSRTSRRYAASASSLQLGHLSTTSNVGVSALPSPLAHRCTTVSTSHQPI